MERDEIQELIDRIVQTKAYSCFDLGCTSFRQTDMPPGSGRSDHNVILINEKYRNLIVEALCMYVV